MWRSYNVHRVATVLIALFLLFQRYQRVHADVHAVALSETLSSLSCIDLSQRLTAIQLYQTAEARGVCDRIIGPFYMSFIERLVVPQQAKATKCKEMLQALKPGFISYLDRRKCMSMWNPLAYFSFLFQSGEQPCLGHNTISVFGTCLQRLDFARWSFLHMLTIALVLSSFYPAVTHIE